MTDWKCDVFERIQIVCVVSQDFL